MIKKVVCERGGYNDYTVSLDLLEGVQDRFLEEIWESSLFIARYFIIYDVTDIIKISPSFTHDDSLESEIVCYSRNRGLIWFIYAVSISEDPFFNLHVKGHFPVFSTRRGKD